ncbi:MAG: hypothetical protein ABW022_08860 [Actinoplanes sp.]
MIRAEWLKFRTVRGWTLGLAGAVVLTVLFGLAVAAGSHQSCMQGSVEVRCPDPPTGPDGQVVEDRFAFAHRELTGDGSLTVRVAEMTGIITYPPPDHDEIVDGMVPWAKAGIMIKDGTKPGSRYAAVLLTAEHGVRWQHDFTHDRPGPASARWLRLTRAGTTITGYGSADGTTWTEVGRTELGGPALIGLFAASPGNVTRQDTSVQSRFTQVSAVFDRISPAGALTYTGVGDGGERTDWERLHRAPGAQRDGDRLTLTGSGDIAPAGIAGGMPVERTLAGLLLALVLVVVVAAQFGTAEHRRGLIRTTLLAEPRRHRVIAAKALVIGAVTFAAGLVATAVTVAWSVRVLTNGGTFVLPAGTGALLRVVVGGAAVLSLTAVLAYGLGAVLRRGLLAVPAAVALAVLPYLLATAAVLPDAAVQWLLRLTPAAGFAIQQTLPAYAHVQYPYLPQDGYFPLAPWAGLAVLTAWAATALGLAVLRLRQGDA